METVQKLNFETWLHSKNDIEAAKQLTNAIYTDLHHLEEFKLCERIIDFSKKQYGKEGIPHSCYQMDSKNQTKIFNRLQFSKQVYLNSISSTLQENNTVSKLLMVYIDSSLYIISIEYASL
jgi:hypothetical protein